MWWLFYTLLGLFLFVCLFLTLLILIQKGRGGGLASAFGGAGGNTAFGAKTGDVLTWATSIVFGVFQVLAILLNLVANNIHARTVGPTIAAPPPSLPASSGAAAPASATPGAPASSGGPAATPVPVEPAPAPGTQPGN